MPYRKNLQREETLLKHWRFGDTVKAASTSTDIPEGTVSHYYARFNRKKDMYRIVSEKGSQEPPRTSPLEAAQASLFLTTVISKANQLMGAGEYTKARDFVHTILLLQDLVKRLLPMIQNLDPKRSDETFQYIVMLVKLMGTPSPQATPAEKTTATKPPSAPTVSPSVAMPESKKKIPTFSELLKERPNGSNDLKTLVDAFLRSQHQKNQGNTSP